MKILFVCRGNAGRSQMAEALFRTLNDKYEVRSAGTQVVSKDGESRDGQKLKDLINPEKIILPLKEKGVDVSEYVRTQLTPDMVNWADKIVVMAESETIPEYLSSSEKAEYWDVKDPKGTSMEEHVRTVGQIEGLVKKFIEANNLNIKTCVVDSSSD